MPRRLQCKYKKQIDESDEKFINRFTIKKETNIKETNIKETNIKETNIKEIKEINNDYDIEYDGYLDNNTFNCYL